MSVTGESFHRPLFSRTERASARELSLMRSLPEREFERAYARRVLPALVGMLGLFVAVLALALLLQPRMGQALWPLFALCSLILGGLVLWALHERA